MFPPNHTSYIKALYKKVLSAGSLFFDDRARLHIKNRARKGFAEYKSCTDMERIKYKIREARKRLHRIEEANRGNPKSALKILEEVYGRKGKTRHALLAPFISCHLPADIKNPEPFIPSMPRTSPPPELCEPLRSLIVQHLGKNIEPELPVPAYKPLHGTRKANLLWKHRSMVLDRVEVPLPFEILCELELKAGAAVDNPLYVGTRGVGGPKWDNFYLEAQQEMMAHLNPHLNSIKGRSVFQRSIKLMESPYATPKKPDSLDFIPSKPNKEKPIEAYSERKKKRLYRRLLTNIPVIDIISPQTLWDKSIKYNVTKSYWVPQVVTHLLPDVPSEQVIKSTLATSKKKKLKH